MDPLPDGMKQIYEWENTYIMEPKENERFIPNKVRAVCERAMKAKLEDQEYVGEEETKQWVLELCAEIKDGVKEQCNVPRHKIMVQVVIAKNEGQGIRVCSKGLWDESNDNWTSYTFQSVQKHNISLRKCEVYATLKEFMYMALDIGETPLELSCNTIPKMGVPEARSTHDSIGNRDFPFGSLDELVGDGEEEEVVDGVAVGSARGALTDTERMAGINHMLLSLGLPQMSLQDSGSVVKAVSSLLGIREQESRRRRDTEEKLARIQSDNKMLTAKVKRLEERVASAGDRVKEAEARLRRAEKDFRHKLSGAMQERECAFDWERTAHQYRGRDRQKEVENRKLAQDNSLSSFGYVKLQRQASERLVEKRSRLSSGAASDKRTSCPPMVASDLESSDGPADPARGPDGIGRRMRSPATAFRLPTSAAYSKYGGRASVSEDRDEGEGPHPSREWPIEEGDFVTSMDLTLNGSSSRGLSPESIHRDLLAEHPAAAAATGAWAMFDPLTSIYPNTTALDDAGSV
ncbi:axonemal dynein light chain, putative [Perkinsus marinus ATCC 50983]|uniref:Axonemal dynein light chain, putative n=1 Tax=Perkinsus marinus (strain ATCC 50983 / TXsc) TaxID=423536 RepID=C5LHZ4_PERM5|nr:axonemal dynein light chain, putative [Perkinsus marinus ATCC 50983]EER03748.1 axonemal dynein light chain, putative [Perkinsus marinus ATCC 50983]|eukprot:XP_002771932.1 axonemal dynein light chain, putative [Perkinsus marinus ATCC 50983]